jgi:hypothetical protein
MLTNNSNEEQTERVLTCLRDHIIKNAPTIPIDVFEMTVANTFTLDDAVTQSIIDTVAQVIPDTKVVHRLVISLDNSAQLNEYYCRHKNDAEILFFGSPFWIATLGIGLVWWVAHNVYDSFQTWLNGDNTRRLAIEYQLLNKSSKLHLTHPPIVDIKNRIY